MRGVIMGDIMPAHGLQGGGRFREVPLRVRCHAGVFQPHFGGTRVSWLRALATTTGQVVVAVSISLMFCARRACFPCFAESNAELGRRWNLGRVSSV